jgi:hypothetical protein
MTRNNSNITLISDLPELNDIDNIPIIKGNITEEINPRYAKFIRTSSNMNNIPYESGMSLTPHNENITMKYETKIKEYNREQEQEQEHLQENRHRFRQYNELNCIVVSEHILNCPICSKLYKSDNNIHNIIIIMLCIVILLLLKKILDTV